MDFEISHIAKNINVILSYDVFFQKSLSFKILNKDKEQIERDQRKNFPLPLNPLCVSSY